MQINLEDNFIVPLGRKAAFGALQVNAEKFEPHVHAHIYTYGLRQILNDAIADKKDDEGNDLPIELLVAKAEKRLDTLYSGTLRAARDEIALDPFEQELLNMIKPDLQRRARSTPEWKLCPKAEKDKAFWTINFRALARKEKPFENWLELCKEKATNAQIDEAQRRVNANSEIEKAAEI